MKKTSRQNKRQKKKKSSALEMKGSGEGESVSMSSAPPATMDVASSTQTPAPVPSTGGGTAALADKPRVGFFTFIRQVRAEMARVTWPTRSETIVTTILVFIMVTLAALFFLLADQVLSFIVAWILGAR